ncbi:uncharacterized protein LOC131605103 [Vicia villosa]|uniref:uncharacterized protein LOC131605103 n=1 Tax=Vicia villosa TaxID=3911 RepID=UPI00273B3008|nr:uncharacterized protein LOC131605103 [Vicia villosa]
MLKSLSIVDAGAEEEAVLLSILCDLHSVRGMQDKVGLPNANKQYYVLSFYKLIMQVEPLDQINESIKEVIALLWEVKVPSKVKIFIWRLLFDKLFTRHQLIRRNIIPNSMENHCPFSTVSEENVFHLFFNSHTIVSVWDHVLLWLDKENSRLNDTTEHFLLFNKALSGS